MQTLTKPFIKPPANYPDTLIINFPAAVFYQPDSQQLISIKAVADTMFYESSMHEYFYQMLTARIRLKKPDPLKIVEANKYRFLLFIKKDNSSVYIDLDARKETHGLFVFDRIKSPVLVDMTI